MVLGYLCCCGLARFGCFGGDLRGFLGVLGFWPLGWVFSGFWGLWVSWFGLPISLAYLGVFGLIRLLIVGLRFVWGFIGFALSFERGWDFFVCLLGIVVLGFCLGFGIDGCGALHCVGVWFNDNLLFGCVLLLWFYMFGFG